MKLITEYLFGPKDLYLLLRWLVRKVQRARISDWVGVLLLLLIWNGADMLLGFGIEGRFFWTFFIALFYWNLDSRISIGLALIGLIIIPALLASYEHSYLLTGDIWAERVAVWVYFFLVIGVVRQIFEFWRDNRLEGKTKPQRRGRSVLPKLDA